MRYFHALKDRQKKFWTREKGLILIKMAGLFILALVVQHFANNYVQRQPGIAVSDFIFDHIPTLDIDFLVIQGALILTFIIVGLLVWKPRYLLFTMGALSMFIITRAFFISLTHLGANPHELVLDTNTIGFSLYNILFNTRSDFFFSGHTGVPFLMGLIFMRDRFWGKFFFVYSAVLGASVLFAHIHYSIDVFAAPFMTYGIYTIAKKLFLKEYNLTQNEEL